MILRKVNLSDSYSKKLKLTNLIKVRTYNIFLLTSRVMDGSKLCVYSKARKVIKHKQQGRKYRSKSRYEIPIL